MWNVHRESLRIKLIVRLGFYPYLGWGLEYSCGGKNRRAPASAWETRYNMSYVKMKSVPEDFEDQANRKFEVKS